MRRTRQIWLGLHLIRLARRRRAEAGHLRAARLFSRLADVLVVIHVHYCALESWERRSFARGLFIRLNGPSQTAGDERVRTLTAFRLDAARGHDQRQASCTCCFAYRQNS